MVLDFAPTVRASSRCRRRFFPASRLEQVQKTRRRRRKFSPNAGRQQRCRRERHCDHVKTIEVREREFEVVKNEMAEVVAPPQRVVEGAKARKVDDDQGMWPLPPYMAVPYPEQRGPRPT